MSDIINIKELVDEGYCLSCMACKAVDESIVFEDDGKILRPIITDNVNEKAFNVCPAKGYDFSHVKDTELGDFVESYAGRINDATVLRNASSGGLMTGFAIKLLENGYVDGVITTKIIIKNNQPRTSTFIAKTKEEILTSQGSKYCPVPLYEVVKDVVEFEGKLLLIGTPCQIASFKMFQNEGYDWTSKIILTFANFCGGYRDNREASLLIKRSGFKSAKLTDFSYRGDGQPGYMNISGDKNNIRLKYPDYARGTGITKFKRCRFCYDATGEFADISFGDAWLKRFSDTQKAWSIFLIRSYRALDIYKNLLQYDLEIQDISRSEIIKSQLGNITSKKYRYNARFYLMELFSQPIPNFKSIEKPNLKDFLFEVKVLLSQKFFSILEKIKLYVVFTKLTKRYPTELK